MIQMRFSTFVAILLLHHGCCSLSASFPAPDATAFLLTPDENFFLMARSEIIEYRSVSQPSEVLASVSVNFSASVLTFSDSITDPTISTLSVFAAGNGQLAAVLLSHPLTQPATLRLLLSMPLPREASPIITADAVEGTVVLGGAFAAAAALSSFTFERLPLSATAAPHSIHSITIVRSAAMGVAPQVVAVDGGGRVTMFIGAGGSPASASTSSREGVALMKSPARARAALTTAWSVGNGDGVVADVFVYAYAPAGARAQVIPQWVTATAAGGAVVVTSDGRVLYVNPIEWAAAVVAAKQARAGSRVEVGGAVFAAVGMGGGEGDGHESALHQTIASAVSVSVDGVEVGRGAAVASVSRGGASTVAVARVDGVVEVYVELKRTYHTLSRRRLGRVDSSRTRGAVVSTGREECGSSADSGVVLAGVASSGAVAGRVGVTSGGVVVALGSGQLRVIPANITGTARACAPAVVEAWAKARPVEESPLATSGDGLSWLPLPPANAHAGAVPVMVRTPSISPITATAPYPPPLTSSNPPAPHILPPTPHTSPLSDSLNAPHGNEEHTLEVPTHSIVDDLSTSPRQPSSSSPTDVDVPFLSSPSTHALGGSPLTNLTTPLPSPRSSSETSGSSGTLLILMSITIAVTAVCVSCCCGSALRKALRKALVRVMASTPAAIPLPERWRRAHPAVPKWDADDFVGGVRMPHSVTRHARAKGSSPDAAQGVLDTSRPPSAPPSPLCKSLHPLTHLPSSAHVSDTESERSTQCIADSSRTTVATPTPPKGKKRTTSTPRTPRTLRSTLAALSSRSIPPTTPTTAARLAGALDSITATAKAAAAAATSAVASGRSPPPVDTHPSTHGGRRYTPAPSVGTVGAGADGTSAPAPHHLPGVASPPFPGQQLSSWSSGGATTEVNTVPGNGEGKEHYHTPPRKGVATQDRSSPKGDSGAPRGALFQRWGAEARGGRAPHVPPTTHSWRSGPDGRTAEVSSWAAPTALSPRTVAAHASVLQAGASGPFGRLMATTPPPPPPPAFSAPPRLQPVDGETSTKPHRSGGGSARPLRLDRAAADGLTMGDSLLLSARGVCEPLSGGPSTVGGDTSCDAGFEVVTPPPPPSEPFSTPPAAARGGKALHAPSSATSTATSGMSRGRCGTTAASPDPASTSPSSSPGGMTAASDDTSGVLGTQGGAGWAGAPAAPLHLRLPRKPRWSDSDKSSDDGGEERFGGGVDGFGEDEGEGVCDRGDTKPRRPLTIPQTDSFEADDATPPPQGHPRHATLRSSLPFSPITARGDEQVDGGGLMDIHTPPPPPPDSVEKGAPQTWSVPHGVHEGDFFGRRTRSGWKAREGARVGESLRAHESFNAGEALPKTSAVLSPTAWSEVDLAASPPPSSTLADSVNASVRGAAQSDAQAFFQTRTATGDGALGASRGSGFLVGNVGDDVSLSTLLANPTRAGSRAAAPAPGGAGGALATRPAVHSGRRGSGAGKHVQFSIEGAEGTTGERKGASLIAAAAAAVAWPDEMTVGEDDVSDINSPPAGHSHPFSPHGPPRPHQSPPPSRPSGTNSRGPSTSTHKLSSVLSAASSFASKAKTTLGVRNSPHVSTLMTAPSQRV